MTQKLQKLKANMLVILDLTKNQPKQMLLQKEILMQKLLSFKIIQKKLQTFYSNYFRSKNYFDEDGKQDYLVFLQLSRYFRLITNKKYISSWKSKGLCVKTITPYATSDNSLTPWIDQCGTKIRLTFNKSCLKQSNTFTYDKGKCLYCL